MYFIADIQYNSNPYYIDYLIQKSSFLLDTTKSDSIFYLFFYIIQKTKFTKIYHNLLPKEKYILEKLMDNFGVLQKDMLTPEVLKLEKKYDWIFFHPNGDLFIPLEIAVLFTEDKNFSQKNYLINLLCNIPKLEKKYWINVIHNSITSFFTTQLNTKKFQYSIDIFIITLLHWYYKRHYSLNDMEPTEQDKREKSNTIIPFYQSKSYSQDILYTDMQFSIFIIKDPISFHDYIKKNFYKHYSNYKKYSLLREKYKKDFYYSIQMAFSNEKDDIIFSCFSKGIWVPIFPKSKNKKYCNDILIVTPREVVKILEKNQ